MAAKYVESPVYANDYCVVNIATQERSFLVEATEEDIIAGKQTYQLAVVFEEHPHAVFQHYIDPQLDPIAAIMGYEPQLSARLFIKSQDAVNGS